MRKANHSMKWAGLLAAAAVVACPGPEAHAIDRAPDSFVWIFSDTGYVSQDSALAMSRGLAWPVVFGESETITLRPTQDTFGNYWHQIGNGVGGSPDAASSPDGRVVGAGLGISSALVSPTGTTTFLPQGTISAAFTSSGALVYANNNTPANRVTGFAYPSNGPAIEDIAISPFGDGGVLTVADEFYSTLTGNFENFAQNLSTPYAGDGSLTFDAQGRPHIIDRNANVFSFDTTSAQWAVTNLGLTNGVDTSAIAADSQGTVGAAFVDANGDLIYGYWTNSAGWQNTLVDTGVFPDQVGLAFDHDDLPVISYSKQGNLWVAYDPIAVPEPASLTLLAGLGVLAMGRRRRS